MKKVIAATLSAALLLPCLLVPASANIGSTVTSEDAASGSLGNRASDYEKVKKLIDEYGDATQNDFNEYTLAASKLSKSLLTCFLTKEYVGKDDMLQIFAYTGQMRRALLNGINESGYAIEKFVGILAENSSSLELSEDDGMWGDIIRTLDDWWDDAGDRVEELLQQLQEALKGALTDDQISEDELREITEILNSLDEEMAAHLPQKEEN